MTGCGEKSEGSCAAQKRQLMNYIDGFVAAVSRVNRDEYLTEDRKKP